MELIEPRCVVLCSREKLTNPTLLAIGGHKGLVSELEAIHAIEEFRTNVLRDERRNMLDSQLFSLCVQAKEAKGATNSFGSSLSKVPHRSQRGG